MSRHRVRAGRVARGSCAAAVLALVPACSAATPTASESVVDRLDPTASLTPINSFHVSVQCHERLVRGADGSTRISWQVDWRLSWQAVPGASGYAVYYGTSEGASDRPKTVQPERTVTVEAAAGTSTHGRLRADQRAALLFTSSQLLVAVAARGDGRSGQRSAWFPVGDVPLNGVPVGTTRVGSQ